MRYASPLPRLHSPPSVSQGKVYKPVDYKRAHSSLGVAPLSCFLFFFPSVVLFYMYDNPSSFVLPLCNMSSWRKNGLQIYVSHDLTVCPVLTSAAFDALPSSCHCWIRGSAPERGQLAWRYVRVMLMATSEGALYYKPGGDSIILLVLMVQLKVGWEMHFAAWLFF